MTTGYLLPAAHVIHAVGPVWWGGEQGEDALLASCYRSALELADSHSLRSIAFAAISCGSYGYPLARAAAVSVAAVIEYLKAHAESQLQRVCWCAFDSGVEREFLRALREQRGEA